jgi:hypothetical protein
MSRASFEQIKKGLVCPKHRDVPLTFGRALSTATVFLFQRM